MESKVDLIGKLFRYGAVVKVDVSIWSATKKLNPSDIGLTEDDINDDLVSLGNKRLLPHDEIYSLEKIRSKANAIIESNSMKFNFGSFVPNEKVGWVKDRLEALKKNFDEMSESLVSRYPELRQSMLNQWQIEATSIASRKNDPQLVWEVMTRIEQAFPKDITGRFKFKINEYRDINKVVEEFIANSTFDLMMRFKEFADKLRTRIEENNINDRNLKPLRDFVNEIWESAKMLQNNEVDSLMEDLAGISTEGYHEDLVSVESAKQQAFKVFDKIDSIVDDRIDEIKQKSIDSFTKHSRTVEM